MHGVLMDASYPDSGHERPRWSDLAASVPAPGWFIASGVAAALVVRVRGSSLPAHLGFIAAAGTLLAAGAWVERVVFRIDAKGLPAPAHQIVFGQVALLVYFYARSALSYAFRIPGVRSWELYALGAAAAIDLLRRRRLPETEHPKTTTAYVVPWLLWWASTLTYLGYRSGRLEPPSTDPDLHALWARLTAQHGRLIYDLLPQNSAAVAYPSGFSALNAVWIDLSFASAVTVVNCQVALQACLAVALILEMVFAIRRGPAPLIAIGLLGLAHAIFSFPVNALSAHLEGTPRLSHKALALFPMTFAARLSCSDDPNARVLRSGILAGSFALGWAPAINPASCFVELPLLFGAAMLLFLAARRSTPTRGRGETVVSLAVALGLLTILLLSDGWVRSVIRGLPSAASPGAAMPIVPWGTAVRFAFARAKSISALSFSPSRCIPSVQCPSVATGLGTLVSAPLVLIAIIALFRGRSLGIADRVMRGASVVVAISISLWTTAFLADFVPTVFSIVTGRSGELLRGYAHAGLTFSTALLSFALLGAALALAAEIVRAVAARRRFPSDAAAELAAAAALAVACGVLVAGRPELPHEVLEAYSRHVHGAPVRIGAPILPEDVRLARRATLLVRPGESVLLPGVTVQMSPSEVWYFAAGGGRAIPLYTDVPFAFFHQSGADIRDGYRDHVCDRLDLPWLAERGIVWVYEFATMTDWACVHAWLKARETYFELKLRDGGASLWRLRTDLLAGPRRDPLPPP
jgi:hypothetical protein